MQKPHRITKYKTLPLQQNQSKKLTICQKRTNLFYKHCTFLSIINYLKQKFNQTKLGTTQKSHRFPKHKTKNSSNAIKPTKNIKNLPKKNQFSYKHCTFLSITSYTKLKTKFIKKLKTAKSETMHHTTKL